MIEQVKSKGKELLEVFQKFENDPVVIARREECIKEFKELKELLEKFLAKEEI